MFGISWIALGGNSTELTLFLASSNILYNLALSELDKIKLASRSLFLKINWVSTLISSSTTRPGVGFIISWISVSFSESATSLADSNSIC